MAKVTVLLGGQMIGTNVIKKTPWVVGRDAGCGVRIENVGVSRRHCQFTYENGRYHVQDLGSSNGTFIAGKKVTKAPVADGTQVSVGKYVLLFEDQGLELIPSATGAQAGGRPSAARPPGGGPVGLGGAQKTFQVDSQTLREQMAKAGVAAGKTAEAHRAADVARAYNPDAPLEIRAERQVGRYFIAAVKLLAVALVAAGAIVVGYIVIF